MVRPCGFSPLRRFSPPLAPSPELWSFLLPEAPRVAGLLHPAADRRVRRVSRAHRVPVGFTRLVSKLCTTVVTPTLRSSRRVSPSKKSPRSQPFRISTVAPSVPLFLCFHRLPHRPVSSSTLSLVSARVLGFEVLLRARVRTFGSVCATEQRPLLPGLGSPPRSFQSPPRRRGVDIIEVVTLTSLASPRFVLPRDFIAVRGPPRGFGQGHRASWTRCPTTATRRCL